MEGNVKKAVEASKAAEAEAKAAAESGDPDAVQKANEALSAATKAEQEAREAERKNQEDKHNTGKENLLVHPDSSQAGYPMRKRGKPGQSNYHTSKAYFRDTAAHQVILGTPIATCGVLSLILMLMIIANPLLWRTFNRSFVANCYFAGRQAE